MGFYSEKIFPWVLDLTESPSLKPERTRSLQGVAGEVLEIGFGTGGNLPHYPRKLTRLTAVEPSDGMNRRAAARVAEWGGTVELVPLAGERLPFEDCSFDTVVITQVLCSAADVRGLLREAWRVLRPGGTYHFLEHMASTDPVARKWQDRLDRMHRSLAGGCSLTRDPLPAIRDTGFTIEHCSTQLVMPGKLQAIYPFVRGVAVKPA